MRDVDIWAIDRPAPPVTAGQSPYTSEARVPRPLPDSEFELKLPSGVKKSYPQKGLLKNDRKEPLLAASGPNPLAPWSAD